MQYILGCTFWHNDSQIYIHTQSQVFLLHRWRSGYIAKLPNFYVCPTRSIELEHYFMSAFSQCFIPEMVISIPPSSWFLQLFRLGSCRHGTVALWVKCWVFAEGFIDGTMLVAQVGGCRFAFYWCGLQDSASSLTWSLVPCLGKCTGNCTVNDQNHSWRSIRVSFGTGPPDSRSISSVADSSVSWIDCKAAGRLLQLYLCPCLSMLPLWPCSSLYFLLQLEWDLTRATSKGPYILIEELRRQNRALFIWDNAAWNLTSQQFWLTSWIVLKAQGQNIKPGCLSLNWTWQWMPIRRNLEN